MGKKKRNKQVSLKDWQLKVIVAESILDKTWPLELTDNALEECIYTYHYEQLFLDLIRDL
jgi:hypothetical protein